jgi:hypothetical protein
LNNCVTDFSVSQEIFTAIRKGRLQVPQMPERSAVRAFEKCRFPIKEYLTNVTIMPRRLRLLKAMTNPVDTVRMSTTQTQPNTFDENCLTVLECYAVRDVAAKATTAEYSGWLDRILEVPGLEPAVLTSIHGFLIAQGLIKFEFTGRSVGLQYQLSSLGKECVARKSLSFADDLRNTDNAADYASEAKAQAA